MCTKGPKEVATMSDQIEKLDASAIETAHTDTQGNGTSQSSTTSASVTAQDSETFNQASTSDIVSPVEDSKLELGPFPVIEELLDACINMLRSLIQAIKLTDDAPKDGLVLTRAVEALVLWGDRHQAFNGTLDKILYKSKKIRRMTILSLNLIARNISQGIWYKLPVEARWKLDSSSRDGVSPLLQTSRHIVYRLGYADGVEPDAEDSDDSSDGEDNNLALYLGELDNYVRCLIDLDSVLSNPVLDPEVTEHTEQQLFTSLENYHHFYLRIKDMFSGLSEDIAKHLGRANFRRYRRLCESRIFQRKQEAAVRENLLNFLDPLEKLPPLEMAERQGASNIETKTFHDSGVGTSIQTESIYAESALSSNVSVMGDGKYSTFPPLTKEAKAGAQFNCDACGQPLVVTKPWLWKRHLIDDLRPYLCIYPTCSSSKTYFATASAWIQHTKQAHAGSKLVAEHTCPFCLEVKNDETYGILTHVSKHLEVISAISIPRNDPDDDSASDAAVENTRVFTDPPMQKRFGCPFFKHDGISDKSCLNGWTSIRRLK
ncbi:hypothetical protein F5Y10DRAFT_252373 [Nemania abortiva]|nr:hypothetical protein F5Y10DRAFT_252373 [Nemania abortiva]